MHLRRAAAPVGDADQRLRTGFDQTRHSRIPALALLAKHPGLRLGSTGTHLGHRRVDPGGRASGTNHQRRPAAGPRLHNRHLALVFPAGPHRPVSGRLLRVRVIFSGISQQYALPINRETNTSDYPRWFEVFTLCKTMPSAVKVRKISLENVRDASSKATRANTEPSLTTQI